MNTRTRILNLFRISSLGFRTSRRSGFLLIEGILAAALLGMLIASLVGLFIYGQESTRIAGDRMRAVFLAEEGIEAVRNIRDSGVAFLNIPADGTYGLAISSNTYALSGSSDFIDNSKYKREIIITSLTVPIRKKVVSKITWDTTTARPKEVQLENNFGSWRP